MKKILSVKNISKRYGSGCKHCLVSTGPNQETNICPYCHAIVAIQNIGFELYQGEILGIMGESGSGKSTVVKTLYFDESIDEGEARYFDGEREHEIFNLNAAQQRALRQKCFGMVYQNPVQGLNFNISAGGNIAERLLMSNVHHYGEIRQRAKTLLKRTEVLSERMDESPKHFSGGMQQRVQIAKALATKPRLLFLDEVTTGLDLSVQAAILDLIKEIQRESQTTMIVVTHDLGVIRLLSDRAIVMKYGHIIESGLTDQILEDPQHAYTQKLVASAL